SSCGQAPSGEVPSREDALQATIAALQTQVAQKPQPVGSTQEALFPTEAPLAIPTSEVLPPTEVPLATPEPIPLNRVGPWEFVIEGTETLPTFSGAPPAEGHTWYGVNLLVVNTTNQVIPFDPYNNMAT